MNCKILSIFSTPLIHFQFSKHKKYFFNDVPKSVRKPETWIGNLNTSYPNITENDPFIDEDIGESLKKDLLDDLNLNLQSCFNDEIYFKFKEFWYNIYHDDQNQEKHWHMNSLGQPFKVFLSGIYFNKNTNMCRTTFHREDGFYKLFPYGTVENSPLEPFFFSTFFPYVSDGDVIVFPPYLWHEVVSNNQDKNAERNDMRLTFSFNLIQDEYILLRP